MSANVSHMSVKERADRIVSALSKGTGPILLCMPGTTGGAYQSSMYETARSIIRQHGGAISVASIPYDNGVKDVVKRFLGFTKGREKSVLAHVVLALKKLAPHRPIYVVGESQGAWAIAQDLHDPEVAAAISRSVLFAKPGFQRIPEGISQAVVGANILGSGGTPPKVVEFRHTDDIVPSIFGRILNPEVPLSWVKSAFNWVKTGSFEYKPHHYDAHGDEAAKFLLTGVVPGQLTHRSSSDTMPTSD